MFSIFVASTILGQWKGWDGAAGQPAPKPASVKVTRVDKPAAVRDSLPGADTTPPIAENPVTFEPAQITQKPTSGLVVKLASLRERAAELASDIDRNALNYRMVSCVPDSCNPGRDRLIRPSRPAPAATPASQAARYLSLHKRMRHQLVLVTAEITRIEDELRRRGVDV